MGRCTFVPRFVASNPLSAQQKLHVQVQQKFRIIICVHCTAEHPPISMAISDQLYR